ncbi:MAG: hypothetical protein SGI97_08680 [candidate division Zixibacteria bacterium]|nr:hypothetical protein [candidate division Zixibacteria bacterium]
MLAVLLTSWLLMPIAPLNPVEQDTLASVNFHITAGMSGTNGILTEGPELSTKYELLLGHPYVIRAAAEYKLGEAISPLYPRGKLQTITFAFEGLYYRGTTELLAYLGGGLIYAIHHFSPRASTSDSLFSTEQVTDIDVGQKAGYRLVFGLRYLARYSIEMRITELHPSFIKSFRPDENSLGTRSTEVRASSIALSFGYLIPIRRR